MSNSISHFDVLHFRELDRKIGNGPTGAKTSSKNGKSSADSEGSPDEGISLNNRKKPGTLNDNFTRQRYIFPWFYFICTLY